MSQDIKWVTITQAIQQLGIGRTKMYYLRKSNELTYSVHGRKIYILRSSIDEYLTRYSTIHPIFNANSNQDEKS